MTNHSSPEGERNDRSQLSWGFLGSNKHNSLAGIETGNSYKIRVEVSGENHEQEARNIIRAVNSLPLMIEALTDLSLVLQDIPAAKGNKLVSAVTKARIALALARGFK